MEKLISYIKVDSRVFHTQTPYMSRLKLNVKHRKHKQRHQDCGKFIISALPWLSWIHHHPNCRSLTAIKMLEGMDAGSRYRGPSQITEILIVIGYVLTCVLPTSLYPAYETMCTERKVMDPVTTFIENVLSFSHYIWPRSVFNSNSNPSFLVKKNSVTMVICNILC